MNRLLVSPSFSEMSPVAPGRIAYTGLRASARNPEEMNSSPCAATGVGTWSDVMPLSSHFCVPDRSYDRTFRLPVVTISVPDWCSHMNGVDQLLPSSRGTRQATRPVRLSYAVMDDRSSWSLTTSR